MLFSPTFRLYWNSRTDQWSKQNHLINVWVLFDSFSAELCLIESTVRSRASQIKVNINLFNGNKFGKANNTYTHQNLNAKRRLINIISNWLEFFFLVFIRLYFFVCIFFFIYSNMMFSSFTISSRDFRPYFTFMLFHRF